MMLLRGFMGELGLAAMSVTEVGAVLGSVVVHHQRCLLVAAAGSLHDALMLIRHSEHQIYAFTNAISKGYVNTQSHAWETSWRRWSPCTREKISVVDPKKKTQKTLNTLTEPISVSTCPFDPRL